ncbi:hypothetical protein VNF293_41950 (plasmid) [Atlantibacter hermannii]
MACPPGPADQADPETPLLPARKKELNVPPKACCAVGVIPAKPECISALASREARLRAHISGLSVPARSGITC